MASKDSVPYRPLGMVTSMLKNLGFEVTHWYDDLVFVEHNAFLIQMGEKGEDVVVWFNVDSFPEKRSEIMAAFVEQESLFDLKVTCNGTYRLIADKEQETLKIEFMS